MLSILVPALVQAHSECPGEHDQDDMPQNMMMQTHMHAPGRIHQQLMQRYTQLQINNIDKKCGLRHSTYRVKEILSFNSLSGNVVFLLSIIVKICRNDIEFILFLKYASFRSFHLTVTLCTPL